MPTRWTLGRRGHMSTRTSTKRVAAIAAITFGSLALLAGPAAAGSAPNNNCLPPPMAGVCAPAPG
jgi:hypothetical protein